MLGLKILVQVQTFRRTPFASSHNFYHPWLGSLFSLAPSFLRSLGIFLVSPFLEGILWYVHSCFWEIASSRRRQKCIWSGKITQSYKADNCKEPGEAELSRWIIHRSRMIQANRSIKEKQDRCDHHHTVHIDKESSPPKQPNPPEPPPVWLPAITWRRRCPRTCHASGRHGRK